MELSRETLEKSIDILKILDTSHDRVGFSVVSGLFRSENLVFEVK